MWDLTNGKMAFRKKLPHTKRSTPYIVQGQKNEKGREVPVRMSWSPDGLHYAVLYPSHLVIFDAEVRISNIFVGADFSIRVAS